MGEMASTLAHELNQPLAAIASYNTGCLNLRRGVVGSRRHPLRPGKSASRPSGCRIVRRVHDFVRKSEPKRAPCLVQDVVEDRLGFLETDARKRQVRIDCRSDDPPPVLADRLMPEQVLLNLMRNGMDAMVEIEPTCACSLSPSPPRAAICRARRRPRLRHRRRRQGKSCSHRILFDQTRRHGVGLSICRSIVEFHRGRLWADLNLDSPTGSGTIFTFTLPLETYERPHGPPGRRR